MSDRSEFLQARREAVQATNRESERYLKNRKPLTERDKLTLMMNKIGELQKMYAELYEGKEISAGGTRHEIVRTLSEAHTAVWERRNEIESNPVEPMEAGESLK